MRHSSWPVYGIPNLDTFTALLAAIALKNDLLVAFRWISLAINWKKLTERLERRYIHNQANEGLRVHDQML